MSTRTSLSRTSTTRPRTTSPSSTSLTPRLNQYSMLSSEASPTSFAVPARVLDFRFSLSMNPPLLGSKLSVASCCRVRHSSRASGLHPHLLVPELRDRSHHLLGRFTIRLLAAVVTRSLSLPVAVVPALVPALILALALESQRGTERHPHFRRPGQRPPAGERRATAGDEHRHHRRSAQHREHAHSRLALAQRPALLAPRALGEHEDGVALGQDRQRRLQRPHVRAIPSHRPGVQGPDQPAEERDAEQLLLGHEYERTRRRPADQGRIEHAHVVGDEEHRTGGRNQTRVHHLEPEEEAHQRHRYRLQDRVQHLACSTTRSSVSTTSVMPSPVVSTTTEPSGFTRGAKARS